MLWQIDGPLLEVQGCIERALDLIDNREYSCQRSETSAIAEYDFTSTKIGQTGRLKISVLPKSRTELYGYPPKLPDDKWLVQYLQSQIPLTILSQSLQALLLTYAWQIKHNVFQLSAKELFQLAHSEKEVDYGWNKYGLHDLELRTQAMAEFQDWRKRVHERKLSEFDEILGVIEGQIMEVGLAITKPSRSSKLETSSVTSAQPLDDTALNMNQSEVILASKPNTERVKNTRIAVSKYDGLCRQWVNRPYIPRQTKDEFLSENASELDKKTFDRILKDAYEREVIDKDPGPHGRYKPRTVS